MNGSPQAAQRQESEDGIAAHSGLAYEQNGNTTGQNADIAWSKFNLLSLDGGGIRGYWSLLALQLWMENVAMKEEADAKINHSFYPKNLPKIISQIPSTLDERDRLENAESDEERFGEIPPARRYLPCHYFNMVCGSSTGALIAIMLGRFRMTVPDCIYEYEKFGQEIFGKPRFFTHFHFGVGNRHKFDAKRFEKVIKDFTKRRNEKANGEIFGKITFPSRTGLCTTFVTTKKSQKNGSSGTPYFIRSYDHDEHRSPNQSKMTTRASTFAISRNNTDMLANPSSRAKKGRANTGSINYEKAQEFEIWEVARAATAAPLYFEPLKIEKVKTNGYIYFTDGGFGRANNPTREGKREIEDLHGRNSIGIIVSVGTARGTQEKGPGRIKRIPRMIKGMANEMSNPEVIHDDIIREQKQQGFPYYRLNDPGGLDIELDRWEPKQTWFTKDPGFKTITDIKHAFAQWAMKPETIKQFQACAVKLVECRRERMNTSKWELYATGARYRCRFKKCSHLEKFSDREKIEEHLSHEHGMGGEECSEEVLL